MKVESKTRGIPNQEERGLEEVHVRGGRSGEIAYMIDGMYVRNPIFGGIGSGTRLNLFAINVLILSVLPVVLYFILGNFSGFGFYIINSQLIINFQKKILIEII